MHTIKQMKFISLLILLVFYCSCKESTTEVETKEFINTLWELKAIENDGKIIMPPEGQIYTIEFLADSTFSGSNACNVISGRYNLLTNFKIVIERLGTTFAGCSEGTIHNEYYGALNDLRTYEAMYEIQMKELHINYGVNSKIVFISR